MNPMQPVIRDDNGHPRFKKNAIVRYLLDNGGINLNRLARLDFPQDDWEQFAQLIGYSIAGFHELSYVSDETALAASKAAEAVGCFISGCRDEGCKIHSGVKRE